MYLGMVSEKHTLDTKPTNLQQNCKRLYKSNKNADRDPQVAAG